MNLLGLLLAVHLPPPVLSLDVAGSWLSPPYLEAHLFSTAPIPAPGSSPESGWEEAGDALHTLADATAAWQQWDRVSAVSVQPQGAQPAGLPAYCTAQAAVLPPVSPGESDALTVQVNQVPVGQVATAERATAFTHQLHQALPQLKDNASQMVPVATATGMVVMVGDEAVIDLTPTLGDAESHSVPRHRALAVQWVNNLRQAMDAPPLTLGDMQRAMEEFTVTADTLQGLASWYGPYFHGRQTATGEVFDQNALTAAHPSLPFGTYLEVRNLLNDRTVVVRVNDRGPYVEGRNLDLSYAAAQCLDSTTTGVVPYVATVVVPSADSAPTLALAP